MSRFYYAQINEANTVFAISDLSGEVIADNMIAIDEPDASLMGAIWDGVEFTKVQVSEQELVMSVPVLFFRSRFTNDELYKIYGSEDIATKIFLDDLRLKTEFLVDESMSSLLQKMVDIGIITQSRKEQIFQECSEYR